MKKSINITLNGLVFSLEEDAYEMLKKYLDSIKEYYKGPEEEKEILADIESSIAEKFSAKLKSSKQAITLADVEEVIKVMGTVEEITESEEGVEKEKESTKEEASASKKRLYRSTDDVIIAGVASGIAAYFGIDPVFVRIVFVILAFANGIGILAYLVFWIAMPKAETSAQKLEMRGKPVNLAEIEQVVKEKSKMVSQEGKETIDRLQKNGTFKKLLNFPIKIVEIIFLFIKRIWRVFWPIASITVGVFALLGSIFGILGISIASSLAVFNINSPYLISDLPLAELASSPIYYIGIISLYATCVLPLIFLSVLGITLIRRKNSFNLVGSSILVGIWMLAVIIFVVAAVNLVPMIRANVGDISQENKVTKIFDYKDFNKLYLGGYQNVKVTQGDEYSIKLTGRQREMDRLQFNVEDGQLQITQKQRNNKGICIFCFDREITGEIVVPNLDSFVGISRTNTTIRGFDKDVYISLGESANADFELEGQNLAGTLSGVGSNLELSGSAKTIDIKMDGSANLTAEKLVAQKIKLALGVFSSARLEGEANDLEAKLTGNSSLTAKDLAVENAKIETRDFSAANMWVKEKLEAASYDNSSVAYKGEPKTIIKNSSDFSSIEIWQGDNEDRYKVYIKTDVKQYSPLMSSIRGIGLTPEFYGEPDKNIIFRFTTNQGYLVENWNNINYVQEVDIRNEGEKIYWTFLPDAKLDTNKPIYVNLEVRPEGEDKTIANTQIEFKADDQGMVTQKVNK